VCYLDQAKKKLDPCYQCGAEEGFLFDGYTVGGRLLEGVQFLYQADGQGGT